MSCMHKKVWRYSSIHSQPHRWMDVNVTLGLLNIQERPPVPIQVEAGSAQSWYGPICT